MLTPDRTKTSLLPPEQRKITMVMGGRRKRREEEWKIGDILRYEGLLAVILDIDAHMFQMEYSDGKTGQIFYSHLLEDGKCHIYKDGIYLNKVA